MIIVSVPLKDIILDPSNNIDFFTIASTLFKDLPANHAMKYSVLFQKSACSEQRA